MPRPRRVRRGVADEGFPSVAEGAAAARVNAPANGLLITAILNVLVEIVSVIYYEATKGGPQVELEQVGTAQAGQLPPSVAWFFSGPSIYAQAALGVAGGLIILWGALKMKDLQSYGLAYSVSILAMVPFLSPFCCLGLPIGIWALMALHNQEVKAAFH